MGQQQQSVDSQPLSPLQLHDDIKHLVDYYDEYHDEYELNDLVTAIVKYVNDNYLERPKYHEHHELDDTPYIEHNHDGRSLYHEHYGTHSVDYPYYHGGDSVLRPYPNDDLANSDDH